ARVSTTWSLWDESKHPKSQSRRGTSGGKCDQDGRRRRMSGSSLRSMTRKTARTTAILSWWLAACSGSSNSRTDGGRDGGRAEPATDGAADVVTADDATEADTPAVDAGDSAAFVHPGLLHTQADFDRMKEKVDAKASPWIDSWNILIANRHADLNWTPNPQTEIHRNDGMNPDNYMTFVNDVAAAYA